MPEGLSVLPTGSYGTACAHSLLPDLSRYSHQKRTVDTLAHKQFSSISSAYWLRYPEGRADLNHAFSHHIPLRSSCFRHTYLFSFRKRSCSFRVSFSINGLLCFDQLRPGSVRSDGKPAVFTSNQHRIPDMEPSGLQPLSHQPDRRSRFVIVPALRTDLQFSNILLCHVFFLLFQSFGLKQNKLQISDHFHICSLSIQIPIQL